MGKYFVFHVRAVYNVNLSTIVTFGVHPSPPFLIYFFVGKYWLGQFSVMVLEEIIILYKREMKKRNNDSWIYNLFLIF